jgi:hypothetical protein
MCVLCAWNVPLNTVLSTVSSNTTPRSPITLNIAAIISRGSHNNKDKYWVIAFYVRYFVTRH